MAGAPNLPGSIASFGGPVFGGEEALRAVEKDEGLGEVGVFVFVLLGSGEGADANAGLSPVGK